MSLYENLEVLGYTIGETSPYAVNFLATRPPRLGEYVIVEHSEGPVLGMVEHSSSGNPFVPLDAKDINVIERTVELIGTLREYVKGKVRLLTLLESIEKRGKATPLKTPPKTGAKVYVAPKHVLEKIFAPESPPNPGDAYVGRRSGIGYVRLGVLANHPEVPVYVKVDPIVARHLAILAVTGAGKSNTVSVLSDRIVRGLGGTILIFDMHGEYSYGEIAPGKTNIISPKINPLQLSFGELRQLARIREDAVNQERALRVAYRITKELTKISSEFRDRFIDKLIEVLEYLASSRSKTSINLKNQLRLWGLETSSTATDDVQVNIELEGIESIDKDAAYKVIGKLDDMKDMYRSILDPRFGASLKNIVRPGYLNVVDLGEIDDDGSDVIVSYYTRRVLQERKIFVRTRREGYPSPILLVLEEAHILVPRDSNTFTKQWVARIAREGRKFGVGLCLVSQRPKNIDENALSQTNNKIILKIVEPNDKSYVQRASEQLSDELLELLPSLNVGEAVLIGELTPLPALVKIDEHPKKLVGRDLKVTREWLELEKKTKRIEEEVEEFFELQEGKW